MGIRCLNKLIYKCSKKGTQKISLFKLKGKTVVVDISIYLYKFASIGKLIENIYLLCSTLQFYGIKPICIFDGFSPKEKTNEIIQRRERKKEAEKKYIKLENIIKNEKNKKVRLDIKKQMNMLKRKFITVSRADRKNVKELLTLMGISFYQAKGEADELCANLVIKGEAYACLSEDTDLFVYGCPYVLRYLSLRQHTAILYNLDLILQDLKLNLSNFRKICILSGTDYNNAENNNIFYFYNKYKYSRHIYINDKCQKIYNMFDLKNKNISKDKFEFYDNLSFNKKKLHEFLKNYNFVFI